MRAGTVSLFASRKTPPVSYIVASSLRKPIFWPKTRLCCCTGPVAGGIPGRLTPCRPWVNGLTWSGLPSLALAWCRNGGLNKPAPAKLPVPLLILVIMSNDQLDMQNPTKLLKCEKPRNTNVTPTSSPVGPVEGRGPRRAFCKGHLLSPHRVHVADLGEAGASAETTSGALGSPCGWLGVQLPGRGGGLVCRHEQGRRSAVRPSSLRAGFGGLVSALSSFAFRSCEMECGSHPWPRPTGQEH